MKITNPLLTVAIGIGAYLLGPWLFSLWIKIPPFTKGLGIVEQHFGSSRILSVAAVLSLAYLTNRVTNLNNIRLVLWRRLLLAGAYFLIACQLLFFYSLCTDYLVFLKIEEKFVAVDAIDALRYDSYLHAVNQLIIPFGVRIDSFRGHYTILSSLRHWGFRSPNVRAWEPWLYFSLSWVWLISVSLGIHQGLLWVSKYANRFFLQETGSSYRAFTLVKIMRKSWTLLLLLVIFCNFRQTMVTYVEGWWGIGRITYLGLGYVLLAILLAFAMFALISWLWKHFTVVVAIETPGGKKASQQR